VIVLSRLLRIVKVEEETPMIAAFILGLLADVVFSSAASMRRAFGTHMERYLTGRGFVPPGKPSPRTTR
jgi:hypothetical protein